MLKPYFLMFSLIAGATAVPSYAQYTQTVTDEYNRVLPIFFTGAPPASQPHTTAPIIATQQRYPNAQPVVHHAPPPRPITLNTPKQAPHVQRPPSDPINGPYYISPNRHRIMQAAHSALGIPYLYGGNNPARGLDCSSLMQFIHKRVGITLPRTAAAQRDRSKTIPYQQLQPGDMLFFKINRRTNHVGIYIGHGKFIHASSSNRRAVISSMKLPYWKKRFVKFGSYLDT